MTSLTKNIMDYHQKALESIPKDHPHKDEIIELLNQQVQDDLFTNAHTRTTKRAV